MSRFSSDPQFISDLRAMCQGPDRWVRWLSDVDGGRPGHYEAVPWKDDIWVHDPLAELGFVEARICKDEAQGENGKTHIFLTQRGKRALSGIMTVCDFDNQVGGGLNNILSAIERRDLENDRVAMALFEAGRCLTHPQRIDIILQIMRLPKPRIT